MPSFPFSFLGLNIRTGVRVQLLVQRQDGGDAADVVGELLGFVEKDRWLVRRIWP